MSMDFKAPMGWHIAYGVSSVLLLAASVIIVMRDYYPPWMGYQDEFHKVYAVKLQQQIANAGPKDDVDQLKAKLARAQRNPHEIKQHYLGTTQWLSEYNAMVERVDRCATCHMAVDYAVQSSFTSAQELFGKDANPFKAHPNPKLMDAHDPEKMGCTMCHGGQGRAVKAVTEAHGQVRFWELPLLDDWTVYNEMKEKGVVDPLTPPEHIQASCAKCHVSTSAPLQDAPLLSAGRQMFSSPVIKGNPNCTTCHRIGDKGGSIGPELTTAGNRWRDAEGWMRAHFRSIYPEAMKKLGIHIEEGLHPNVVDVWTALPQDRYVYYSKWVYEHFLNPPLFMPGYYITQDDARSAKDAPDVYVFSPDSAYLRRYTADDHFIESYAVPADQVPKNWAETNITMRGLTLASAADPRKMQDKQAIDLNLRVSSPRTAMPAFPFTDEEARAMTLFVMGLTDEKLPPQYLVQPAAVAVAPVAAATPAAPVKLAKGDAGSGKALFNAKGCQACHALTDAKLVGPGLKGVSARRDPAWLASWMKDPPAMIATDPKLKDWAGQFGGVIMPNLGLQDKEIADLIAFLDTLK